MKKLIYICICLLGLSCSDHFFKEIPSPEGEKQIFVYCLLEAGSASINAELYWTKDLYGPVDWSSEYDVVNNATVTISNGNSKVELIYSSGTMSYTYNGSFVEGGKTYTLEITGPAGEKLYASTMVPLLNVSDFNLDLDSILFDSTFGNRELLFYTQFRDQAGREDYYQISGVYETGSGFIEIINFEPTFYMISDKDRDGELFKQISRGYYYQPSSSFDILITIQAVSRDFYLYQQSMNAYLSDFYDPGNTFTEPTIVHDNINGGVGIFGSAKFQEFHVVK